MDSTVRADNHGLAASAARVVEITGDVVRVTAPDVPARAPSRYERRVKPVLDFVGAALLLVITSPLIIGAAIAVRLTMGSPVILKQDRVGRDGRVFTIYKFRTMDPDRRRHNVPYIGEDRRQNHKSPVDPRLTPVGRFLRKWSLDELPQFVNVIKGDMSLVGPRPEMVDIVARYAPWQHARHTVKPGITGPWQISERGNTPMHECVESDLAYLDHLTAWNDFKILVATPLSALGDRRGH